MYACKLCCMLKWSANQWEREKGRQMLLRGVREVQINGEWCDQCDASLLREREVREMIVD